MRGPTYLLAAVAAVLLVAPAAGAPKPPAWRVDAAAAARGLEHAVEQGRLSPDEAARYRAVADAATRAIARLAPARAGVVASVLGDVAAGAKLYNRPRALTLFSMLETNVAHLSASPLPPGGRDLAGADGVVYRTFTGQGLQFHPLANAARLNALLAGNRDEEALALAEALIARATPNGDGELYEYWFDFHNVKAPWSSGMAQAVLAQALARAGERFADARFTTAARRAFAVLPGTHSMRLDAGPWVRLYSGLDLVVLNAQLQAALSVADYALLGADPEADAFAAELRTAAAALLPRFDTGAWTRYSLGEESSLDYQRYVVSLLKRLAQTTGELFWRETADRFALYELEAPTVNLGPPPAPIYPVPLDGHRDVASLRVWTSKIGTADVDGTRTRVRRGWNTVSWRPPSGVAPGVHELSIVVSDLAGNETIAESRTVEVRRDVERPVVTAARASGRAITWRIADEGTARVRLVIAPFAKQPLDLGWQLLRGSYRLPRAVARGSLLRVEDAAGNRTHVRLSG